MTDKERDFIVRSFDAELDEQGRRHLAHLLNDPALRVEWDRIRRLRQVVAERGSGSFSPAFADRVIEGVRRAEGEGRKARGLGGRLPTWAALVAPSPARVAWATLVLLGAFTLALYAWEQRPITISTGPSETRTVSLRDGTVAYVSSGTTLTYSRGREERLVVLDGEAFFDVSASRRPFVVETHNARVRVTGTRFNVRAWSQAREAKTAVTVEEGQVRVSPREAIDRAVLLEAGETTYVASAKAAPHPPVSLPLERITAWRDGGIAFVDEPLDSVVSELERRFALKIRVTPRELITRRITYFDPQPSSVESVLSDVCHVLQLNYRKTANGYEIIARQTR